MKLGILTCTSIPFLNQNDRPLVTKLKQKNIDVEVVVWDDNAVDWSIFDFLLFRNTWDYYEKQVTFDNWLKKIQNLGLKTLNAIDVINVNKHKFYLRDLQKQGITLIPTIFQEKTAKLDLEKNITKNWSQIIIKPAFSAGSFQTKLFDFIDIDAINFEYQFITAEKELLLQPFIPEIKTLGETSFVFFNKKFSHAVNKKPVKDDFRIQQQFGGIYSLVEPTEFVLNQAQKIVDTFEENLLYARVDGIVINDELHLMEVELIEPDLYFHLKPSAIDVFVDEIISVIQP